MQLKLTNLLNQTGEKIDIDYHLALDDFMYNTYKPLTNGVDVRGEAYQKVGVVYLDLEVDFDFDGVCDRCADDIHRHYNFALNKILVEKLENDEDDDDYIIVENQVLELDDLIWEELQLFLPAKMLCSEDCKGLCQSCGTNLNHKQCKCKKVVDPRLAALSDLLIEE